MARGTDFGGVHSHRDLQLIQQEVEVQPAEPKLNLVSIPGADGSKDLSEQPAGRVVYKDRKISWTFALYPGENWDAKHSQVSNAINGRLLKITLDTDPNYYYLGRVVVKKYKVNNTLRQITVEANCRPYKLRQLPTSVVQNLTASYKALQLLNDRKPVVPTITLTAPATIRWKGQTYSLNTGEHRVLDIELQEGENLLEVLAPGGSGRCTITYQEGSL